MKTLHAFHHIHLNRALTISRLLTHIIKKTLGVFSPFGAKMAPWNLLGRLAA
jgi:hypothetical protein